MANEEYIATHPYEVHFCNLDKLNQNQVERLIAGDKAGVMAEVEADVKNSMSVCCWYWVGMAEASDRPIEEIQEWVEHSSVRPEVIITEREFNKLLDNTRVTVTLNCTVAEALELEGGGRLIDFKVDDTTYKSRTQKAVHLGK